MAGQQEWQALARSMAAGETFDHSRGWGNNPAYEAKMKAEKEEREQIVKDGVAAMKENGPKTPEEKAAWKKKLDDINERARKHVQMIMDRESKRKYPVDLDGGRRRRKTRKGKKSRRRTTRKH